MICVNALKWFSVRLMFSNITLQPLDVLLHYNAKKAFLLPMNTAMRGQSTNPPRLSNIYNKNFKTRNTFKTFLQISGFGCFKHRNNLHCFFKPKSGLNRFKVSASSNIHRDERQKLDVLGGVKNTQMSGQSPVCKRFTVIICLILSWGGGAAGFTKSGDLMNPSCQEPPMRNYRQLRA